MRKYKLVIIGGGASGLAAAVECARFGVTVALLDRRNPFSKEALMESSKIKIFSGYIKKIHEAKLLQELGLSVSGKVDFKALVNKVVSTCDNILGYEDQDNSLGKFIDYIESYGRFKSRNEIELDSGEIIYGEKIIIATGSKPAIPDIKGIDKIDYSTTDDILDIDTLPQRLLVLGDEKAGLELAQSFLRLGSKVTLVTGGGKILMEEDLEIADNMMELLLDEGLDIFISSSITGFESTENGKFAIIKSKNNEIRHGFDRLIIANGRIPETLGLEMDRIGISANNGKIKTDEFLSTNVSNIFAIGDVRGVHPHPHKGMYEAGVAISNSVFELKRGVRYDNIPAIVYTDPTVYRIGFSEQLAREGYNNVSVYRLKLSSSNGFKIEDQAGKWGMIKIITDNKKRIIGAHAIGVKAEDFMQEIAYGVTHRVRIGNISKVIHPYLSYSEAVKECADLHWKLKQSPAETKGITAYYHKIFKKR